MADDLGIPVQTGTNAGAASPVTTPQAGGGDTAPQAAVPATTVVPEAAPSAAPGPAAQPTSAPTSIPGVPVAPPEASMGPANKRQPGDDDETWFGHEAKQAAGLADYLLGHAGTKYLGKTTLSDYGADDQFVQKMDRTRQAAEKLARFRNMPAAQQAQILKKAGLYPEDVPGIIAQTGADLKEQQQKMKEVSDAALQQGGQLANRPNQPAQPAIEGTKESQANWAQNIGTIATTIGMLGLGPAAAATYGPGALIPQAAITVREVPNIAAALAKSYSVFKIAGYGSERAVQLTHKVFPNAGPYTDAVASLIGTMVAGGLTEAGMEGRPVAPTKGPGTDIGMEPWMQEEVKAGRGAEGAKKAADEAAVRASTQAAVAETNRVYSDPVGIKGDVGLEKYQVTPESKARAARKAQLKAQSIQAQEPTYEGAIPQPPAGTAKGGLVPAFAPEEVKSELKEFQDKGGGSLEDFSKQLVDKTAKEENDWDSVTKALAEKAPEAEKPEPAKQAEEAAGTVTELVKAGVKKEEEELPETEADLGKKWEKGGPLFEFLAKRYQEAKAEKVPPVEEKGVSSVTDYVEGKTDTVPEGLSRAATAQLKRLRAAKAAEAPAAEAPTPAEPTAKEEPAAPPAKEEPAVTVGTTKVKVPYPERVANMARAVQSMFPPEDNWLFKEAFGVKAPEEGLKWISEKEGAETTPKLEALKNKILKKLNEKPRGSMAGRELTEEQKQALRESFGEWAIPAYAAAMNAGDNDKMAEFQTLLEPEHQAAFNVPVEPPELVNPAKRAESHRAPEPEEAPAEAPAEGAAPEAKPEEPAAETLSERQQMAAYQKDLEEKQGQMFKDLDMTDNEDIVNQARKRNPSAPISPEDMAKYQAATMDSFRNIEKLADEHMQAAAADDTERVGIVGDLFQHEVAKVFHLQAATGETTENLAKAVAQASSQSSDILKLVSQQSGPDRLGRTQAIMGWQKDLDPANLAVAASLWNPPLWFGKALTDMTYLPYMNFIKGLSRVFSAHPQDALQMWSGSLKAALGSVTDAYKYGTEAFKYGGKPAERALGMMRGEENTSTTMFDDYGDTPPGAAIQYLASVYNDGTAGKVRQVAGMTLKAGQRVILAEDQFAKTFAFRAAAKTAAIMKAAEEANEQGLGGWARKQFIDTQSDKYVNDMPSWLVKQASDETYQFTFTNYNRLAAWAQRGLSLATTPATRYFPEAHWGRLIGGLYVSTPMNLMREGFLNSPMGLLMPSSGFSEGLPGVGDMSSFQGRAATSLAMTKAAAGTAMLVALYEYAGDHHLTGSGEFLSPEARKFREENHIPNNAIGFAGHYLSYDHMGPQKVILQYAGDMAEIHGAASAAGKEKYWQTAATAFIQVLNHGPLMFSFPKIFHALANMGRGNFDEAQDYLTDAFTTPMRPAIVKQMAEVLSPGLTDAKTEAQRIAQDWPGFRAGVPLKRDHWGYPQYVPPSYERDEVPPNPLQAFLYQMNPLHASKMIKPDVVNEEIMKLDMDLEPIPDMFIGSAGPQGLREDPNNPRVGVHYHPTDPVEDARLKDRLEQLVGHESTINGMNQHDYMEDTIKSDNYQGLNSYWRTNKLHAIHNQFLQQGRRDLVTENPDLGERVRARQLQRGQEMRAPAGGTTLGAP